MMSHITAPTFQLPSDLLFMCVASVVGNEQLDGHTEYREFEAEQEAGQMISASLSHVHNQL